MTEKLRRWHTRAAVTLLVALAAVAASAQVDASNGCVMRSIELEDLDRKTLLRIRTDGAPASIGARVEPGQGVVLDLGCTPGPELSDRDFAEGLVSALRLDHDDAEPGAPTALVVEILDAFEYSVSTQPDVVLVSLRAKDSDAEASPAGDTEADPGDPMEPGASPASSRAEAAPAPERKIRVLEPLPIPAAPPLPAPPPIAPAPIAPAPPLPTPTTAAPPPVEPPPIAPPPAEVPAVAPAPADPPSPAPDTSQVAAAVDAWARAWSEQRVEDYLSAYAAAFQPAGGLSRPIWEARRRSRIAAPEWIEVVLDDVKVLLISPGQAVATFRQSYTSGTFDDEVDKTLTLVDEDGSWKIQREESGSAGAVSAPHQPSFLAPPGTSAPTAGKPTATAIVEGARNSVVIAPAYDASYQFITYPGGDPGYERGSGADVVVRAYRHTGIDLQERVHQDVLAAAAEYGIETPDTHIDHRRIRNLRLFLRRHGDELGTDLDADWRPGDVVFWASNGRLRPDHLGIVSDRRSPDGRLLVIHHEKGRTPTEEDVLFAWTVRGHYRWLPAADSATRIGR